MPAGMTRGFPIAPGPFGIVSSMSVSGQSEVKIKKLTIYINYLLRDGLEGVQRAIGKPPGAPAGAFPFQQNDLSK